MSMAGDALHIFCQKYGVPEKLRLDGSKEQTGKKTEFLQQIRKKKIQKHISKPDMHNQSPVEGVVSEVRKKWYRVMFKNLWCSGIMACDGYVNRQGHKQEHNGSMVGFP
jgi:hypothetical protein